MSYSTTKERLRKAQERLTQSPAMLPVLPVMLPVDVVTGNTVLQVVEQPFVTDVTDVTDKRVSHDGCKEKNIISAHSGDAVEAYNIFSSMQTPACAANAGNIGNIGNVQVVDMLPVDDETPVTSVTTTGNTPSACTDFSLTFDDAGYRPTPAPSRADDLGLNARKDHPSRFLRTVVSDNDCLILYYRAHKLGDVMTTDALGDYQPCDHLVTGYWRGVNNAH